MEDSTYRPNPLQDRANALRNRIFGGLLTTAIGTFIRLIPSLGRLGAFGIVLAALLVIGAIAAFVLLLLVLMILLRQFEVTPLGQLVSLVLTIAGALFAVYLWIGRQTRSAWGIVRLLLLALGLALLFWWVLNSDFFHEARLNYMRARFEQDPVFYVGQVYILISGMVFAVLGAIWSTQRFVRNAYRSPLSFIGAVSRLTLWSLVVILIVWFFLSSGQLENFRSQLDEALNPAWLVDEYSGPAQ